MDGAQLLKLIEQAGRPEFVERNLLGRIPWIFEGREPDFDVWRVDVARTAGVAPEAVYVVGSAATGFSMSPYQPGRPFRRLGGEHRPSDIDIAVVSPALFEASWDTFALEDAQRRLRRLLPYRSDVPQDEQLARLRQSVYWGIIAGPHASVCPAVAPYVRQILAAATRRAPCQGYPPRLRIYRRREDLAAYHAQSLGQLTATLRETRRS